MSSLDTLQKQWSESMTAIVRDASFENNTLHRELTRRVIQSRARKTRLFQDESRDPSSSNCKTGATWKGWGGDLGLKGVGLDKKLVHTGTSGIKMKIELSEHNSDSEGDESKSNHQALSVNQWQGSLPGSRAKTPLV